MSVTNKIKQFLGFESVEEKLQRFEEIKKSFEESDLQLDELAKDFFIEKSMYKSRMAEPENFTLQSKIQDKFDIFIKGHKESIRKAKKQFDSLKKEKDEIEKSLSNHKYIKKEIVDGKPVYTYTEGSVKVGNIETSDIFHQEYKPESTTLVNGIVNFLKDEWSAHDQAQFNKKFSENSKVEKININEIIPAQRFVSQKILHEKIDKNESIESNIQIYKFKGKLYLNNGYHRVAASISKKEKEIEGEILDLDQMNLEDLKYLLPKDFDIEKAFSNHKYIRKEPDGKGGWNYVYEEEKVELKKEDRGTVKFFKEYSKFPEENDEHSYYHTTFFDKLEDIEEKGLNPNDTKNFEGFSQGKKVSLSPNNKDNEYWSSMLFWQYYDKYKKLPKLVYLKVDKNSVNPEKFRSDEVRVGQVHKDALKIWNGKEWVDLSDLNKSILGDFGDECIATVEEALKIKKETAYEKIKKAYQHGKISLDSFNTIIKGLTNEPKTQYSDFLLFNENGEILLLKRSSWEDDNAGAWVIPGGHVDPGEDFKTAAIRELQEESGYNVEDAENVGSYEDDKCHIEYFQAYVNTSEKPIALQFAEVRDYKWIPVNEICEEAMVFNMRDNLLKILGIEDQGRNKKIIRKAILEGIIPVELIEKAKSGIYKPTAENKKLGRVGQKYGKEKDEEIEYEKYKQQKEDFLDVLKSDYVIDFNSKNKQTFDNFYRNSPNEMLEDLCLSKMIGNLSNNLPENIVLFLSKARLTLQDKSKYERESGGYWVGAFDENFNEVNINREVYEEIARDWYGQEQFTKVLIHELGHKLYRNDKVSAETLFDLWKTKERVSQQAKFDYEENFCEVFAAYLMALSDQGDSEDNRDLMDFREEFPQSEKILKQLFLDLDEK